MARDCGAYWTHMLNPSGTLCQQTTTPYPSGRLNMVQHTGHLRHTFKFIQCGVAKPLCRTPFNDAFWTPMPYTHLVGLLSMARHILWQSILWNHSFWPIFVDRQNLAGSCGRILWVTGLLHYNSRQFITLFRGDMNSCLRVTHEIHEHFSLLNIDDSTVLDLYISQRSLLHTFAKL